MFDSCSLAQLMSLCNQTLHLSSSLSMIFTPSSYSSCCNVTLLRASSDLSEYILINVNQIFSNHSSLKIFDDQMQSVDFIPYRTLNRTLMKTNVIHLPVLFSLCQFNLPSFEIFVTNISRGKEKSPLNQCTNVPFLRAQDPVQSINIVVQHRQMINGVLMKSFIVMVIIHVRRDLMN